MAGKSDKTKPDSQPNKAFDEFADDAEGFDEDVPSLDAKAARSSGVRSRDWRDVEKYREQRDLKRLVGDDLDHLLDELTKRTRNKP
jgi:hypothetical protein